MGGSQGEGKARQGEELSAEFGVLSAAVRCYYLMSSAPVKCNKIVHDKQFVKARLHLTYNTHKQCEKERERERGGKNERYIL